MEGLVKIQFYDPDVGYENLWATNIGNELYRIESVPFFVYGVSVSDIVSARPDVDGRLQFVAVKAASKNRTVRARAEDFEVAGPTGKDITRSLGALGCTTEILKPRIIAISIPSEVNLEDVTAFLTSKGIAWEYANPTYEQIESKPS
jgi:Domain of unknown function (DUF4265)